MNNISKDLRNRILDYTFLEKEYFKFGHYDKCVKLLNKTAKIDYGRILFHRNLFKIACEGGHMDIIQLLIRSIGNKICTSFYNEGLCGACEGNQLEIIKFLEEKGADDWDRACVISCKNGTLETIKHVYNKSVNQESVIRNTYSYIINACTNNNIEAVKFLIERTKEEAYGYFWASGIYMANKNKHTEIVELLTDQLIYCTKEEKFFTIIDSWWLDYHKMVKVLCDHNNIEALAVLLESKLHSEKYSIILKHCVDTCNFKVLDFIILQDKPSEQGCAYIRYHDLV